MSIDGRVEARMAVPAGVTLTAFSTLSGTCTVTLTAGNYFQTTLQTHLQTVLNAQCPVSGNWTVSMSTGAGGTGLVTISAVGDASSTLTWVNTTLRDVLGFTTNIAIAGTGTRQARGLWIPDCPIGLDSDPSQAPLMSDLRTTMSPTGVVLGLVGNVFYIHKNVRWTHVAKARVWESAVTYANSSWEYFFRETQLGLGSSWFVPASPFRIYDHTGGLVGVSGALGVGVTTWQMTGVTGTDLARVDPGGWTGLWKVLIPQIVSSG